MLKIKFFCYFLLFFTTNSFAGYYSLTRTDMITPKINGTVSSEMNKIISNYRSIEELLKNDITLEIQNKNDLGKGILQEKVIGNTLIEEIKQIQLQIEEIIYLKEEIK